LDEDEYDRRRHDIMAQLDSGSKRSAAAPVPVAKAGDGREACEECGDVFDELAPPFCANCGAKTAYWGKTSMASEAGEEDDDVGDLPLPPRESDDFGHDMLDDLLDDLRSDLRSTPSASARTTKDAASGRSTGKQSAASRDTYAVKGDERFSERERETSRESKAVNKAKAKAVGAKPAVGGDAGWEALQAQMKQKQAAKAGGSAPPVKKPAQQQQQPVVSRGTFAVKGDERFSERAAAASAAKPKAEPKAAPKAEPKAAPAASRDTFATKGDERFSDRAQDRNKAKPAASGKAGDASWDALQAKLGKQQQQKQPAAMRASEQQRVADELDQPASSKKKAVQSVAIPKGLGPQETEACMQLQELLENDLLSVEEYNSRVAHIVKTRASTAKKAEEGPMEIPDGLGDEEYEACVELQELLENDLLSVSEYNARVREFGQGRHSQQPRGTTVTARQPRQQEDADFDAELAALEMDLGDNLAGKGRRVVESTRAAPAPAVKKAPVKKMVVEKAAGGPELPEGLSWVQTPVKTEMHRGTFAHRGDDRFSDRADPNLPKGTLTESPVQACAFCHKGIVANQKFKTALGAVWHYDCFKCGVCLKTLEKGMKIHKGDMGSALCDDCKQKRRHVCFLCKKPTAKTEIVNVMGAKIHTACFRCNVCDASLLAGYVQSKGQFLCIAHKACEPVERHWGEPGDKAPGQAPEKAPVQFGPTEEDRRRAAAKRLKERETRSSVQAVEKDLDMLAALLEQDGAQEEAPRASRLQQQRQQRQQEEDDFFRESEIQQSESRVRASEKPRQSDARQSDARSSEVWRLSEVARVGEVRKPSRNSGRVTQQQQPRYEAEGDDDDNAPTERLSSVQMMDRADQPDWMKQREEEERGSFRTNVRKKQEELNKRDGVSDDAGYYSMSSSDEDEKPMVKMTYSSQQNTAPQKKK
jgi:hypothetical protein